MEKETKVLFGAVLLGALAFFIPLYFGMVWLALFNIFVIAFLFLGRLVTWSKDIFESKSAYRIMYGLVGIIVLFNAISFTHDYARKDFQKNTLLEIRKIIDTGVTKADVQEKLVYVLGQYHQYDRESIVDTFRELMPESLGENGVYISDFDLTKSGKLKGNIGPDESDQINHFYEINEEEDEIKVLVVADVSIGQDPEYRNYDGQYGKFEMMFTLNEKGVSYEVLN